MSLRRAGTRRVPNSAPGAPKPKTTYQTVKQGFTELYNPQKENGSGSSIDVDIVFVPGLGAHPVDSWRSENGFNWATGASEGTAKTSSESSNKKDGLAKDFPKARILLYQYESAWVGDLKVRSFMRDIAKTMLEGLQANREGIRDRPIVFIGHSMGGLVIAKAIVLAAETYRELFPRMFECITGCAFFGTPFGGTHVAAVASMLGEIGEKLGYTKSSALVKMMAPGDESLNELRNDFLRLVRKLSPSIELHCFYENHPTDFTQEKYGAAMSKIAKTIVPKKDQDLVPRESATLQGIEEMGLAANHRDLVKFSDFKDSRYQLVRGVLKRIIHAAGGVAKSRLNSTRGIDQESVNSVMELLNGSQVSKKRRMLAQQYPPSTWIPKEAEYLDWLKDDHEPDAVKSRHHGQALFVRGPEGRGKTRATMAALQGIDKMIQDDEKENHGRGQILAAYFFCEASSDFSTAEDLLKSLVRQLIGQQAMLAAHAKHFLKKKGEDSSKTPTNLTVENLWQTLQDILTDEFIGRRVYFVVNNLHALPEDAESTIKLMRFLNAEMQELKNEAEKRVPTRWFFTSRDVQNVEDTLKMDEIRLIDLEDDQYCDQVQLELRKTAQQKVQKLGGDKNYNKALMYFASSLIGKRASNSQWIQLSCMQLAELPATESDLRIRHMLESMPQELKALLDAAWSQILRANEKETDKIKELLRTLVLVFEEPTLSELAVLAGFPATEEGMAELQDLVDRCRPLLVMKRTGKPENTIGFMEGVVKEHLLEKDVSKKMLGMSGDENKWQHGIIALRCLAHIKEKYNFPAPEKPVEEPFDEDEGSEARSRHSDDEDEGSETDGQEQDGESDGSVSDESESYSDYGSDWDEDSVHNHYMGDDEVDEAKALVDMESPALPYPIKHWLHHASKATVEIAEDLSVDDFWDKESLIRDRWLLVYMYTTNVLGGFQAKHFTALHIAAAVGFKQLVSALIQNGHDDEINQRDELDNIPLHLAAYMGRPNIVDELLKRGANIDDGIDNGCETPLHMAASAGHVKIMNKLIQKGADANAIARETGPVMNAAISSGNPDAVRLLVEKDVALAVEDDSVDAPLALAGLHSDLSMFEYLIQTYADKLPPKEFDKAFIKAADSGRVDVFNKLLTYHHSQECFQDALNAATEEENWDIVMILLEQRQDLDCNDLFLQAAITAHDEENKVLSAVWEYTNGNLSKQTLNDSLYEATDREKESTVRLLLESFHIDPNATGEEYGTALTAAAYDGTLNIVRLLLDKGADFDSEDGWPLQAAASEGHYEVVAELLRRGAEVNAFTESENFPQGTALQAACESGKLEIARLLIEHGADPDLGAGEDCSPIIAAASRGEKEILELLVNAKAEVNVCGSDKSTALIHAVINLPVESLQVLFDAGADINMEDDEGDTALIVAAQNGDEDSVRFLLNHGADIFHTNHDNENALQSALSYGDNNDCTEVLVDRVSEIMAALQKAMHKGNTAVAKVIRSVGARHQSLSYDDWEDPAQHAQSDKASTADGASDGDDGKGQEDTPQTEYFPNSARKIEGNSPTTAPVPFRPRSEKISHELEAAIAAQVSMMQQFGSPPPRPDKLPEKEPVPMPPTTIAGLPSQRRYSQQVQLEDTLSKYEFDSPPGLDDKPPRPLFMKPPTLQWTQQGEGLAIDPMPSPGQGPIKRKPAPSMAFGASYAPNPSPTPSNLSGSQYPPPAQQSQDQRPAYQNATSYPGAPAYQGSTYPGQPVLSQPAQNRVSSEYLPHPPSLASYHAPYAPSSYRPSPGSTPPQNTQPFPDLPGSWQSSPPPSLSQLQPPPQQASSTPGSGSPSQSHQQQEWYSQEPRPDAKPTRASFLGMKMPKNTLDKAKQFSTGIMNRKTSGF